MALFMVALIGFLFTSAPWTYAENLLPPAGATPDSTNRDMRRCLGIILREPSGPGQLLKGVDRELLQGKATTGFLFEGSLAGPRPVAPRDDGQLGPRSGLFDFVRSASRTDPYVVCLLLKGYRWAASQETGIDQLHRIADHGNIRAQTELGRAYYHGWVRSTNNSIAFKYLSRAAASNDPDAEYYLAILYDAGDGVLPDGFRAAELLRQAAKQGHPQAIKALPKLEKALLEHTKDRDAAAAKLPEVRAKAETGDVDSQNTLARYYLEGIGVSADVSRAIEWFKRAASGGDATALVSLGIVYDKGRGVTVDLGEAVKWYRLAAEKGDAQAQFNYGVFLYEGRGVDRNEAEGRAWVRKAAQQNYRRAVDVLKSME